MASETTGSDGQENVSRGLCPRDVAEGRGATLWLDCQAGIAGDMLVAALLDVAEDGPRAELAVRRALESLRVDGFAVEVKRVAKSGISCLDFAVKLDAGHENHDHDMEYLHGSPRACDHALHEHAHEHRGIAEITALIEGSVMAPRARSIALRAFDILAHAEAEAHGLPLEQVHFHEVGAIDSIVDVVAAAVLMDHLDICHVVVPVLMEGTGTIRCQHGVIPVPVPATLNICRSHRLPLGSSGIQGELVTPTGAALVAAFDPSFELPDRYLIRRVGLGAGKRRYERPSLLRAALIDPLSGAASTVKGPSSSPAPASACPLSDEVDAPTNVVVLSCDLDDATGEQLGYASDRLAEAGAREVHWVPVFTKKGRPAYQLQVVCLPEEVPALESVIFSETSTLGIRRVPMERTVLARERVTVETEYGGVAVKRAYLPDGSSRVKPEHEDCARLAKSSGVPLRAVADAALAATERTGS